MSEQLDAGEIDAGPAGEDAVSRLAKHTLRSPVIERELVSGECPYSRFKLPGSATRKRRAGRSSAP